MKRIYTIEIDLDALHESAGVSSEAAAVSNLLACLCTRLSEDGVLADVTLPMRGANVGRARVAKRSK